MLDWGICRLPKYVVIRVRESRILYHVLIIAIRSTTHVCNDYRTKLMIGLPLDCPFVGWHFGLPNLRKALAEVPGL